MKSSACIFFLFLLLSPALFSALAAAGEGGADDTWARLVEKAAGEGDYGRALDYLSRIELSQPDNPYLQKQKSFLLVRWGERLYGNKNFSRATEVLLEAAEIFPGNTAAYRILGEISYYSQRLEEARRYWEKVLKYSPGETQIRQRLEQLKRELSVEDNLSFSSLANFDIRYHAGSPDYDISDIQGFLLDAYQDIGYDFNYYPRRPIVVILYPEEEFEKLKDTPRWLGGLYDGKIRLPVRTGQLAPVDFNKILWHEYTHAIIHDIAGNNCPVWLHEGLAQYQESKIGSIDLQPLDRALAGNNIFSLAELNKSFGFGLPAGQVRRAYAQAYSFVDFLIRRYGFWRISLILEKLKEDANWINVVENEFVRALADLEKEWIESL